MSVHNPARVSGTAQVYGTARVYGNAWVSGNARVYGNAVIRTQTDIAWVDNVGSGNPMTLHRIETDGKEAWRINAGCESFEAATVTAVCDAVKANVETGPEEWAGYNDAERERWAKQIRAALGFLAASVVEDGDA